jgi:pantoate--beta-alanine ligase
VDIITDPYALQAQCLAWRQQNVRVGLVPTMGYFHRGHLSLMDAARGQADKVVVSLFVNPTQFGPNEDLAKYPRDLERDRALAEEHGVDLLFAPETSAMYPPGDDTRVEVPTLARGLCAKSRPVHFAGVARVVTKLLNLVQPHVAVFGQKDWQQLAIIRRLVTDLFLPVTILGHEIVREPDGLALSSRNVYMTPAERAQAPGLQRGLQSARALVSAGERSATAVREHILAYYAANVPAGRVDYVEIVHPESLEPLVEIGPAALAAVAVQLGRSRLLDNLLLTP